MDNNHFIEEFIDAYNEGKRDMQYDNYIFIDVCKLGRLDIAQ